MRLLFSSDLHALRPAYELFSRMLAEGPYDAGVLAGDLLDDIRLPDEFLIRELGADPDDLFEDLAGVEDEEPWITAGRRFNEINLRGLAILEGRFREILGRPGKPVFLVPGNHDATGWEDGGALVNVHGRRVEFGDWNFVGYRWTVDHRCDAEVDREVRDLAPRVDRRTILVTHAPPSGVLDGENRGSYGVPALRELVRLRGPRWHLFGYVHSCSGRREVQKVPAQTPYPNPRWA